MAFFTGSYPRSLDGKSRLAIPKPLREPLGNEVYVAPGTEGAIAVFPADEFQRWGERFFAAAPATQDVRAFQRLFYGQAQYAELDGQGRLRIPGDLMAAGRIQTEVMLVGVRDHLEVWDRQRWSEYFSQRVQEYSDLANRVMGGPPVTA